MGRGRILRRGPTPPGWGARQCHRPPGEELPFLLTVRSRAAQRRRERAFALLALAWGLVLWWLVYRATRAPLPAERLRIDQVFEPSGGVEHIGNAVGGVGVPADHRGALKRGQDGAEPLDFSRGKVEIVEEPFCFGECIGGARERALRDIAPTHRELQASEKLACVLCERTTGPVAQPARNELGVGLAATALGFAVFGHGVVLPELPAARQTPFRHADSALTLTHTRPEGGATAVQWKKSARGLKW